MKILKGFLGNPADTHKQTKSKNNPLRRSSNINTAARQNKT